MLFIVMIGIMITGTSFFCAQQASGADEDFFSYERFYLDPQLAMGIPGGGRIREELNRFIYSYTDGLYAISSGDFRKAEKHLKEARKIWPEYFGTDFLLALINEDTGHYETAARYYKSYLAKLKNYHSGKYRITGPFMNSLNMYGIEEYGLAASLVNDRLTRMGIEVDTVKQMPDTPEFIKPFLLLVFLGAGYAVFHFFIIPFYKKQKRLLDVPEGFWACRNCGAYNPDLRKECERCGRPRDI